jgi:hypothetical protein
MTAGANTFSIECNSMEVAELILIGVNAAIKTLQFRNEFT